MQFWDEIDDGSKRIIKVCFLVLALVIVSFCWYKVYRYNNILSEDIVVSRSPLREVTLLDAYQKDGAYYVNVVDKLTAKRYENIYVTNTCPNFKSTAGTVMNVALILKANPKTGASSFELARVYDYICTKKNMEEVDKELLANLEKADKDFIDRNPISPDSIETIKSGVRPNYVGE